VPTRRTERRVGQPFPWWRKQKTGECAIPPFCFRFLLYAVQTLRDVRAHSYEGMRGQTGVALLFSPDVGTAGGPAAEAITTMSFAYVAKGGYPTANRECSGSKGSRGLAQFCALACVATKKAAPAFLPLESWEARTLPSWDSIKRSLPRNSRWISPFRNELRHCMSRSPTTYNDVKRRRIGPWSPALRLRAGPVLRSACTTTEEAARALLPLQSSARCR
jgi:hypothetical protein